MNTPLDPSDTPCTTDPDLFAHTIDIAELKMRNRWHRATVDEARAVCAGCGFQTWCIETHADNDGVVAGLTKAERIKLAKTA
jgi:hypothetical protein